MDTTGYLVIDGVPLIDPASTAALAAADPGCRWQVNSECPECHCQAHSCEWGTISEAPWYDAAVPGSSEFFGLYGTLTLGQPVGTTVVTGTGARATAAPKELTFVGLLVACTARGAVYGRDWVARTLEPLCSPCSTRTAEFGLWCPDTVCDPDTTCPDPPEPLSPVDWSTIVGIDGCEDPELLGPKPDTPTLVDDGLRTVTGVRYNPGSFTELPDLASPLPSCHGLRVTFSFTLSCPEAVTGSSQVCVMEAPLATDPTPCCVGLTFNIGTEDETCGCPTPCACPTVTVGPSIEGSPSPRTGSTGTDLCRYSTPLCSKTFACLVDPFGWQNAAPIIEITAGTEPLRNVSITWWEAVQGLPSPATPTGLDYYLQRVPVADPALIADVPARSTVVIDSARQTEELWCPGSDPTAARVEACGGRRYRHHTLCCGSRYWVAVEIDCANPSEAWRVDVSLAGLERI